MKSNVDIRKYAKENSVYLYEVAEALNISEPTIMRWLRTNLTDERKATMIEAIDRVAAQHAAQIAATAAN